VGRARLGAEKLSRRPITLADLLTATQDLVGPGDDRLVVATGRHLLWAGRLTVFGTGGVRLPSSVARRGLCYRCSGCRGSRAATENTTDRSGEGR
jgi:hypothetical protein